jgi:hypothetical protein
MIPDRLMLERLIDRFAAALLRADSRRPVWTSRKGRVYQPGIGPHAEDAAMRLMLTELAADPLFAGVPAGQSIAYPGEGRQKCDLWIGDPPHWVLEVKMARFRGDNGKPDDTAIKDLLSPYPSDRSALTDTLKLATSGFTCRKAMMIYGFDYPDRPLEPAIHAFERLAAERVHLGCRVQAPIKELVHPVHNQGVVYAWEITSATR